MMFMKNLSKVSGIITLFAVIVFGLTGCASTYTSVGNGGFTMTLEDTNGRLTISGIPERYNGSWIFADLEYANDPAGLNLMAAVSVDQQGIVTIGQIVDGSVTLKVWRPVTPSETSFVLENFNRSVAATNYEIHILGLANLDFPEYYALRAYISHDGSRPEWLLAFSVNNPSITFSDGIGVVSVANIMWQ